MIFKNCTTSKNKIKIQPQCYIKRDVQQQTETVFRFIRGNRPGSDENIITRMSVITVYEPDRTKEPFSRYQTINVLYVCTFWERDKEASSMMRVPLSPDFPCVKSCACITDQTSYFSYNHSLEMRLINTCIMPQPGCSIIIRIMGQSYNGILHPI